MAFPDESHSGRPEIVAHPAKQPKQALADANYATQVQPA
jgi:hypothetical protein